MPGGLETQGALLALQNPFRGDTVASRPGRSWVFFRPACRFRPQNMTEVAMRKLFAACFAFLLLMGTGALLSACNTTAGAGQDISATGHVITNGAEKLKP